MEEEDENLSVATNNGDMNDEDYPPRYRNGIIFITTHYAKGDEFTRSDVAQRSGLTMENVRGAVDYLMGLGIVIRTGNRGRHHLLQYTPPHGNHGSCDTKVHDEKDAEDFVSTLIDNYPAPAAVAAIPNDLTPLDFDKEKNSEAAAAVTGPEDDIAVDAEVDGLVDEISKVTFDVKADIDTDAA